MMRALVRRLRAAMAPEPAAAQRELLRLTVRAARRCVHDLEHAASEIPDLQQAALFRARASMWRQVFYPAGGPKDYRDDLHREIARLEREVERLRLLCAEHGVDAADPQSIPF